MRFVTLFPNAENIHLTKDVGLIPYVLYKEHNYESYLVCTKNDDYGNLESNVKGLKLEFINKKNQYMSMIKYIIKNAKKIDVLNMYHLSIHNSLVLMNLYKLINPKGIAYIKLDLDFRGVKSIASYSKFKILLIKTLIKKVNIISAESNSICESIGRVLNRQIHYIPNGYFDNNAISNNIHLNKENIFLTVGRLGTTQKATEILLEAYQASSKEHNWPLYLIGSIAKDFESYIDEYFLKYPELKERIYFVGETSDRNLLDKYYEKARVMVLPSRWESFGLVLVEAMFKGCRLIGSDAIPPIYDLTCNEKYGVVCQSESIQDLSNKLIEETKRKLNIEEITDIIEYSNKNFLWSSIMDKLDYYIKREESNNG